MKKRSKKKKNALKLENIHKNFSNNIDNRWFSSLYANLMSSLEEDARFDIDADLCLSLFSGIDERIRSSLNRSIDSDLKEKSGQ